MYLQNALYVLVTIVTGCADLATPEHAWHKRSGDTATIGCKHYNKTWQIKCEESEWKGVVGSCNASGQYNLFIPFHKANDILSSLHGGILFQIQVCQTTMVPRLGSQ